MTDPVVKTLVTDFTEKPLAHLNMGAIRGFAVRMVDPGTYTLSSIEPWGYSDVDEVLFEDLTPVDAGDEVVVTLEDGDDPVQYFVRIDKRGAVNTLDIRYDRPNAGGVGPQGEQGEKGDTGDTGPTGPAPTRRVVPLGDTATVTMDADTTDVATVAELSQASLIDDPTGTPVDGQLLEIRIKSTSARALTHGAKFRASTDVTLLTTTPGTSLTCRELFEWNQGALKWDILSTNSGH